MTYRSLWRFGKQRKVELRKIEIRRGLAAGAKATEEIPLTEEELIGEKRKRRERQSGQALESRGRRSVEGFYAWELKQI